MENNGNYNNGDYNNGGNNGDYNNGGYNNGNYNNGGYNNGGYNNGGYNNGGYNNGGYNNGGYNNGGYNNGGYNNGGYNNGGYNNGGYNNGGGENPKTLAIIGFVLSFLFPLAGLIVSGIALSKYKQSNTTDGKGFATAGLVIGIVCVALYALVFGCSACIGFCEGFLGAMEEYAALLI